jgi:hypothetical protein
MSHCQTVHMVFSPFYLRAGRGWIEPLARGSQRPCHRQFNTEVWGPTKISRVDLCQYFASSKAKLVFSQRRHFPLTLLQQIMQTRFVRRFITPCLY